jgi:transposase
VQFLIDTGLLGKTTIDIDGSKFKAVNSKQNNYNQKKIDKRNDQCWAKFYLDRVID